MQSKSLSNMNNNEWKGYLEVTNASHRVFGRHEHGCGAEMQLSQVESDEIVKREFFLF